MSVSNSREWKGRLLGVLPLLILVLSSPVNAWQLEKSEELFVKLPYPKYYIMGLSAWTPTQQGYVLRAQRRLLFYSRDLILIHEAALSDTGVIGSQSLVLADDTLIYVLGSDGCVARYNLDGKSLGKLRYSREVEGKDMAVWGDKLMIAGTRRLTNNNSPPSPAALIYDTSDEGSLTVYADFFPDSILDVIFNNMAIWGLVSVNATAYKSGFAITTNIGPEVFLLSPSGELQGIIREGPKNYKGLLDAPPLEVTQFRDTAFMRKWDASWDFTLSDAGICVLNDSFLVVPRRNTGNPYYLDIYNLNQRSFVERISCDMRVAGASQRQLFFTDSVAFHLTKLSAFYLVDTPTVYRDSLVDKPGCGGCGRPLARYEYIESTEGISGADSISAGGGRVARVFSMSAFEPDSLKRFCNPAKKNMFVFYCPTHFAGELLTDTLYACLKDKEDWALTIVLCYSEPQELGLYCLDLPGERILINRNVAIPDATVKLSDMGLPPMAVALSQGGEEVIAGYSLGPRYDDQKKQMNAGITFDEFLIKCGILP